MPVSGGGKPMPELVAGVSGAEKSGDAAADPVWVTVAAEPPGEQVAGGFQPQVRVKDGMNRYESGVAALARDAKPAGHDVVGMQGGYLGTTETGISGEQEDELFFGRGAAGQRGRQDRVGCWSGRVFGYSYGKQRGCGVVVPVSAGGHEGEEALDGYLS